MTRTLPEFFNDMLTAAEHVLEFVEDVSFDDFVANTEKQYAVLRALEIIGEAAKYVPPDIRQQHAHLPWQAMVGMRNIIIHHYFGVDEFVVWRTIQEEIPPLIEEIQQILENWQEP